MFNIKKKHLLSWLFIAYFDLAYSSNNVEGNQNPLALFFPIENSYKNVRLYAKKGESTDINGATKKLLFDSQKKTYGFCLRGIVKNDNEHPLIADYYSSAFYKPQP